jgi:hypothetical protein
MQNVDPIVVFAEGKNTETNAEAKRSERYDQDDERGEAR